jgi:hypothetical protein
VSARRNNFPLSHVRRAPPTYAVNRAAIVHCAGRRRRRRRRPRRRRPRRRRRRCLHNAGPRPGDLGARDLTITAATCPVALFRAGRRTMHLGTYATLSLPPPPPSRRRPADSDAPLERGTLEIAARPSRIPIQGAGFVGSSVPLVFPHRAPAFLCSRCFFAGPRNAPATSFHGARFSRRNPDGPNTLHYGLFFYLGQPSDRSSGDPATKTRPDFPYAPLEKCAYTRLGPSVQEQVAALEFGGLGVRPRDLASQILIGRWKVPLVTDN